MPRWRLYYHFVWSTKDRSHIINRSFEARLHAAIAAKARDMGAIVHAVGGIEDHVHLAASVPPKVSVSKFIGQVKGNSSHFVNHVVKPGYPFSWQGEYGVESFSEKGLPFIVRYIKNQRSRHENEEIQPGFEKMD